MSMDDYISIKNEIGPSETLRVVATFAAETWAHVTYEYLIDDPDAMETTEALVRKTLKEQIAKLVKEETQ